MASADDDDDVYQQHSLQLDATPHRMQQRTNLVNAEPVKFYDLRKTIHTEE